MDLYKEILLHLLYKQDCKVEVTFPNLKFSAGEMIEIGRASCRERV